MFYDREIETLNGRRCLRIDKYTRDTLGQARMVEQTWVDLETRRPFRQRELMQLADQAPLPPGIPDGRLGLLGPGAGRPVRDRRSGGHPDRRRGEESPRGLARRDPAGDPGRSRRDPPVPAELPDRGRRRRRLRALSLLLVQPEGVHRRPLRSV